MLKTLCPLSSFDVQFPKLGVVIDAGGEQMGKVKGKFDRPEFCPIIVPINGYNDAAQFCIFNLIGENESSLEKAGFDGVRLFLRCFQCRPPLLLPDSHPAPCRRAHMALLARFACVNCRCGYRRRYGSFRSSKGFDGTVQFVALCDEENDYRVS